MLVFNRIYLYLFNLTITSLSFTSSSYSNISHNSSVAKLPIVFNAGAHSCFIYNTDESLLLLSKYFTISIISSLINALYKN